MTLALLAAMVLALAAAQAQPHGPAPIENPAGPVPGSSLGESLPGREVDARVARIAFRLATAAPARCTLKAPAFGWVLQHLSQFHTVDRAGIIEALALDRGPGAIVIVPGSPAAQAGLRPGDVLLAINGTPLPPEPDLTAPFDAGRAHQRADAIDDLLDQAAAAPIGLRLLRQGAEHSVNVAAVPACLSRVFLARSDQHNAYADGSHVFLTTGLVMRTRSDDELAFIIAHEMAHNILGHAKVMRSGTVSRGLGRTLGKSGQVVRTIERDADALGGAMMIDAGLDPVAGAAILKRIDTDLGIALFASHDPAGRRIAAMRVLVAEHAKQ